MHISRLPSRVMKVLGLDWAGGQVPRALKLVQTDWCSPLDYQELCPKDCRQCEAKLASVALTTRQQARISLMGLWKIKLRDASSRAIEEGRAQKPGEAEFTGTLAEAAARMLQELGVG
jgi:hypothetical protein